MKNTKNTIKNTIRDTLHNMISQPSQLNEEGVSVEQTIYSTIRWWIWMCKMCSCWVGWDAGVWLYLEKYVMKYITHITYHEIRRWYAFWFDKGQKLVYSCDGKFVLWTRCSGKHIVNLYLRNTQPEYNVGAQDGTCTYVSWTRYISWTGLLWGELWVHSNTISP